MAKKLVTNDKDNMSPMMTHYLSVKQKYQDCIIFYRLGDFYEMFFEDAERASKILGLTLTARDCGGGKRAPMCGIPHHAIDEYIPKLISVGEKIAICEQLEKASPDVKLVNRDVVRIISAGTITENSLLNDKVNNFIASVTYINNEFAVAWADLTTGDFYVRNLGSISASDVVDFLEKINPSEIICISDCYTALKDNVLFKRGVLPRINVYKQWAFSVVHAKNTLQEYFNVHNLSCFDIEMDKPCISACGGIIEYFNETQKKTLSIFEKITKIKDGQYMDIDVQAVRNLELVKTITDGNSYGSLLWLLDKCKTSMGTRNLNEWLLNPLQSIDKINYRLDGVEEIFNNSLLRNALNEKLNLVKDVERICGKISNNNITPRDCEGLAISLEVIPTIKDLLLHSKSKILQDVFENIKDFKDLTFILLKAFKDNEKLSSKDGGYINDGFDKELDRLRSLKANSNKILNEIEEREKEVTGIKTLKVGFNKVFGYYIEVSKSFKDKVPFSYVRRQTLTGGERFITEELKKVEEEILTAQDSALTLEAEIYENIKNLLRENIKTLQRTAKSIACLDTLNAFANVSKQYKYARPTIANYDKNLTVVDGRHPVVEAILDDAFVPNDANLNIGSDRMMIITGPNMAGKSTYMRQVAIITIMAHVGCFVPCKSAVIPLTDKIFTRVGASDNLISDQSTFMVEMSEVALILNKATNKSLLILDEVGRGTSTYDGLSIAWAVVDYIAGNIGAKTLFATHYHELSELEGKIEGVKNYKITVKEVDGKVIFLRKIAEGSANKSFGIEVASLAGVPKAVTNKAKIILKQLEQSDLNFSRTTTEVVVQENEEVTNLIKQIKSADIDSMSPRDALDYLYSLKEQIKNLN